jgi:sigma-B regulation protein RsbU (phosphoserine phosphatase)
MLPRNPASPAGLATTAPPGLPLPAWRIRIRLFQRLDRISWSFLSKISPARRIALLFVALFEFFEVYELWTAGAATGNWIAVILGLVVLFLLLAFELAEHAALRRDVDLSREIAEWLLPQAPPRVAGIQIAFGSRRAAQSGSDYFNAFPHFHGPTAGASPHVFLVMADVAGVGLQGALLMATFQASMRALVDANRPLPELSAQLNRWSWDRSIGGKHFTMAFFADLDSATGTMSYVSAGHQPPVIRRTNGNLDRLDVGGFPLGAIADSHYETGATTLDPGDALVIFTDGAVSAEDHRGELFGEERLLRCLVSTRGMDAEEVLDHLRSSVLSFAGLVPQPDDISFLVVSRSA